MLAPVSGPPLSSHRAALASFEHAYAIAIQRRRSGRATQFIIRTCDPLQPHRTSDDPPCASEQLLAMIL